MKKKRKHGPIDYELRAKIQKLEVGDCFSHPIPANWNGVKSLNKPYSYARKLQITVRVRWVEEAGLVLVVRIK